ncbi:MAG: CBS domain-containing protein [Acidimicrobiia bacterium]|nr:CBS domain-containing protein [Acidimicrobiia bacterium]
MRKQLRAIFRQHRTVVFTVLSLVVGLLAGLAGAALIGGVALVEDAVAWLDDLLGWGRFIPLLTVPVGLVVVWALGQRYREVRGSGVPVTIAGVTIRSGYIPTRSSYLKILATALTIGSGGSAGREGPTVMVGAAIGSSISRYSGLGEDRVRSLVAAGAGAGIGATFNAPIAGMLFALEVILGTFAIRHLNAVVIASVTAAVTTRAIVGEGRILSAIPHSLGDPTELILYAALGLLAAGVGFLFLKLFDFVHGPIPWFVDRPWLRPVVLGAVVAAIVTIEPRILGSGQSFTQEIVGSDVVDVAWWTLLVLVGLKILATAGTLGAHGSGGHFMPALFLGSAFGAAFVGIIGPAWGFSELNAGAFGVVGMAAMFAAVARAPLTAILIVFELTGDYGLVLPLMLATSLATIIADRLHRESVYTIPLVRDGIRLLRSSDVDLLDTVEVRDVMAVWNEVLYPEMTTREAVAQLDVHRHHGLPVSDHEDRLVGILTLSDIGRTGGASDELTVGEVMTVRPITVTPETPVSLALERMASLGVGRLPVVAEEDPHRLVGMFRRETAVKAYHFALQEVTETVLRQKRQQLWARPGADFFEFHIPAASVADGVLLREVGWPSGCTLVSIRRGRSVLIPEGNTELQAEDVVTAFGAPSARSQILERLRRSSEADVSDPAAPGSDTPEDPLRS